MENWYPFTMHPSGNEKYLFVSDLHGLQVQDKIKAALEEYPDIRRIFFLGDVIGTSEMAKLQKLFYNVYNPTKAILAKEPNINDNELFNSQANLNGDTIESQFSSLINFLTTINDTSLQPSGEQVRQITNYAHYGHFVGNLSTKARNSLRQGLKANAGDIIEFTYDIGKKYGVLSHIIEGNWDARTPLDFCHGPECIPIPKGKRPFYLGDFVRKNEKYQTYISYSDKPTIVYDHTDRIAFILWPFDSATEPTMVPEVIYDDYKVILVSHAHTLWSPIKGATSMTPENSRIENNMSMVINDTKATTVIHGHLHDQIESSGYVFDNRVLVHYLPLGEVRAIRV